MLDEWMETPSRQMMSQRSINETYSSDKTKMEKLQILKNHLSNASTHGIQRVINPISNQSASRWFRGIWLLAWFTSAAYMFYQICFVFKQYYGYEFYTKQHVSLEKCMPFPTVTICSSTVLNANRFEEEYMKRNLVLPF